MWGKSRGTPLQGLVLGLTLVAAVGGASRITPTALPQVTDGQVLWPFVVVSITGVAGFRLEGGGCGRLCKGNAGY